VAGCVWLLRRHGRRALLAGAPGLVMLVLAVLLAAGKPAEFARFLLLPAALLAVAAAALLARIARLGWWWSGGLLLLAIAYSDAPAYFRAFATDANGTYESRRQAGAWIETYVRVDETVGLLQEPAPYAVPPMNFAERTVYLLPSDAPTTPGVASSASITPEGELPPWLVFTADDVTVPAEAWWQQHYRLAKRFPPADVPLSGISWANKPVFVYERVGE
jgi:hypothetical protein